MAAAGHAAAARHGAVPDVRDWRAFVPLLSPGSGWKIDSVDEVRPPLLHQQRRTAHGWKLNLGGVSAIVTIVVWVFHGRSDSDRR
jgi:hypothetical protein